MVKHQCCAEREDLFQQDKTVAYELCKYGIQLKNYNAFAVENQYQYRSKRSTWCRFVNDVLHIRESGEDL